MTDKLELLLNNKNNLDTDPLQSSLFKHFDAFPKFIHIQRDTEPKEVHGNEDFVHSEINCTAFQIKCSNKIGTEIWHKKKGRANLILINNQEKLGIIIEFKYNGSADDALEQAQKYLPIVKVNKNIEMIKTLGINVTQDKTVDIKSKHEIYSNNSA